MPARHPLLIAAQLVVRSMGGFEEAAKSLGKSPSTLRHELNEDDHANKLGLMDAMTLTQSSGDQRIVVALAAECGGVFMPLPQASTAGSEDTVRHIGLLVKEFGELLSEVSTRAADGVISDNDLAALQRESLEMMGAMQALLVHLAARNASTKLEQRA